MGTNHDTFIVSNSVSLFKGTTYLLTGIILTTIVAEFDPKPFPVNKRKGRHGLKSLF